METVKSGVDHIRQMQLEKLQSNKNSVAYCQDQIKHADLEKWEIREYRAVIVEHNRQIADIKSALGLED
jgi:wobble nucleotide-excising tRNase